MKTYSTHRYPGYYNTKNRGGVVSVHETGWAKWPKVGSLNGPFKVGYLKNGPFQVGYLKKMPISGGLFVRKAPFQVGCKNPVATLHILTRNPF